MGFLLGRSRIQRAWRTAFCFVALATLLTFWHHRHGKSIDELAWSTVPLTLIQHDYRGDCSHMQGRKTSNIAVTMKTGNTEAHKKLPAQLRTTLSCVPNPLILSDLDGSVFGKPIIDVVKRVSPSIQESDSAFKLYREQQSLRQQGLDLLSIGKELSTEQTWRNAAWMLDRFKFPHMLNLAWQQRPGKDWYVFVEADTYIVWPNLLDWLAGLDPSKDFYIGSKEMMYGTDYVYGGSGIVISRAAMRKFVDRYATDADGWDTRMQSYCCGDYGLGVLFSEIGVAVTDASFVMSQSTPWTIAFGPTGVYCNKSISLHHLTPSQVDTMWSVEHTITRNKGRGVTFPDLYDLLYRSNTGVNPAMDWDNRCAGTLHDLRSEESQQLTHDETACRSLCKGTDNCFQTLFRQGEVCRLFSCFTLGKRVEPHKGKSWVSWWDVDKFEKWKNSTNCLWPND